MRDKHDERMRGRGGMMMPASIDACIMSAFIDHEPPLDSCFALLPFDSGNRWIRVGCPSGSVSERGPQVDGG